MSFKINTYVFTGMGLEILFSLTKSSSHASRDLQSYSDPLYPILLTSLESNYIKIAMLAIKCITPMWSNKIQVCGIKENMSRIIDDLLKILHKYATSVVQRNSKK